MYLCHATFYYFRILTCSRWSELTDALKFHAQIAHAASAPTEFRLLNSSVPISIGTDDGSNSLNVLLSTFEGSPNGGTPLCRHIKDVVSKISLIEHQLRANNQRACVMIATDGESSDGDIAEALKPLERLPVWVVVRLCTDDDKIVDYWNNIDKVLELDMDVLDDLFGEADEVLMFFTLPPIKLIAIARCMKTTPGLLMVNQCIA